MGFSSRIAGLGSYLPDRVLTNADLEKMVDTNDAWILERTGIAERHIAAADQATSDLALQASLRALEAAQLQATDIDAILMATVTGDQLMPSTACLLQAKLGCREVMALDISAACTGFVYGLTIADQFVRSGMYKNVLVVGGEVLSRIINYQDRQTCILFGDGAGAAIVQRTTAEQTTAQQSKEGSDSRIFSSHLAANGHLGDVLSLVGGGSRIPFSQEVLDQKLHLVQMKGREVFKAAVRAMAERCQEALTANGLTGEDVNWFVVHQANQRIIEAVSDLLKIPADKQLSNIKFTGNTSSASIPILFDQSVRAGKIKRGDLVLCAAFGGGLTSGSILLRY